MDVNHRKICTVWQGEAKIEEGLYVLEVLDLWTWNSYLLVCFLATSLESTSTHLIKLLSNFGTESSDGKQLISIIEKKGGS